MSDHTPAEKAAEKLTRLDEQARLSGLHGRVGVQIEYQNGKADRIVSEVYDKQKLPKPKDSS